MFSNTSEKEIGIGCCNMVKMKQPGTRKELS
jgi:hypothetical protein